MALSQVQMPENKDPKPSALENAAKILGIGVSLANMGSNIAQIKNGFQLDDAKKDGAKKLIGISQS